MIKSFKKSGLSSSPCGVVPAFTAEVKLLSKNRTVSLSIYVTLAAWLEENLITLPGVMPVKLVFVPTTLFEFAATATVPLKFVQILFTSAMYLSASNQ